MEGLGDLAKFGAPLVWLVDDYGHEHALIDRGGDELEGEMQLLDGPMRYWIPRHVARTWTVVGRTPNAECWSSAA